MTNESDDRSAWDQTWASMPYRRLSGLPKIDVGAAIGTNSGYGELVDVTISAVPTEYADQIKKITEHCPVCGEPTTEPNRLAASLYPKFSIGLRSFRIGAGVWIHKSCFDECPMIDGSTPIPW